MPDFGKSERLGYFSMKETCLTEISRIQNRKNKLQKSIRGSFEENRDDFGQNGPNFVGRRN